MISLLTLQALSNVVSLIRKIKSKTFCGKKKTTKKKTTTHNLIVYSKSLEALLEPNTAQHYILMFFLRDLHIIFFFFMNMTFISFREVKYFYYIRSKNAPIYYQFSDIKNT